MLDKLALSELRNQIETFARESEVMRPMEAERRLLGILAPLLEADGYSIKSPPRTRDIGFDLLGERPTNDATPFRVGVQYKHRTSKDLVRPSEIASYVVDAYAKNMDRVIFLTNTGFTKKTIQTAQHFLPTAIELLDLNALRGWLFRIERKLKGGYSKIVAAVIDLAKQCARLIANDPGGLDALEWRDMERMLAEIFKRFGFEVILTPGSKDKGKDLILHCTVRGTKRSYIVEIKHWRSRKRVGKRYLSDFVNVIAREQHERGLYLATYGFSSDAFEALTEIQREKIKLGVDEKVVSLCRTFVKAESGIWSPPLELPDLLFEGTAEGVAPPRFLKG